MPTPRPARRLASTGVVALLAGLALALLAPAPVGAVVTPQHGFHATVDGFTSWYGSYGMGSLGTAWCVDHGIPSPDPAYRYVPTDLAPVATDTRVAMAWALGRHGGDADRVTHAALMLAVHDLMGASYPSERLDVHRLTIARLAGFGGHEAEVLHRARSIKGEALARRTLRGPLRLDVRVDSRVDGSAIITIRLRDVAGRPVPGVEVQLRGVAGAAPTGRTTADGTWRTRGRRGPSSAVATVVATVPRLDLDAWAPTTRQAQRVARPGQDHLKASTPVAPTPTTTTSTTTTTIPATTTTIAPTTTTSTTSTTSTTAIAPTTTTSTTEPAPTTTTASTVAPTVPVDTTAPTTAPPPPPPAASATPAVPSLPRTGTDPLAWALVGTGLLLIGSAAVEASRRRE